MTDLLVRGTPAHDLLELFLSLKEARGLEPVSIRNYRTAGERFLAVDGAPHEVGLISGDHLIRWMAALRREGLADRTLFHHQQHLYVWLRWLYEREEIERDVTRALPMVRVRQVRQRSLDRATMVKLLTVANDRPRRRDGHLAEVEHRLRNVAVLSLLWSTGLRRGELSSLNLDDVDFPRSEILVRLDKAKRTRRIPFDPSTKAALLEYLHGERGRDDGPLFYGRGGARFSSDALRLLLQRLSARAGVKASAHDFRRGFASRVRKAGLDVGHTAKLLGHSTLTMTLHYSQEGEEDAAISAYRKVIG